MTKEELEKTEEYDLIIRFKSNKPKYEIRDYIIEHTLNEFDNLQMWDFKRSSEFAEPREKRIAELEAEVNRLKLNEQLAVNNGKNLLKENAELKKKLNVFSNESANACFAHNEKSKQLTKAKDHIKKLLDCLKQDTNDPQTNYYVCQYMDKAEQFLSDVEK